LGSFVSHPEVIEIALSPLIIHALSLKSDVSLLAAIADQPLPVLTEITNAVAETLPIQMLFSWLLGCLDGLGSCASVVFVSVDFQRVEVDQVQELLRNEKLIWNFVARSFVEVVIGVCQAKQARPPPRTGSRMA
jgi:hypothetical protein